MTEKRLRILLIEDDPGEAGLIRETLSETDAGSYDVTLVPRLAVGLEILGRAEIDVILLDLNLPDSRGLDTLTRTLAGAPRTPVIVLSELDDREMALQAIQQGALEYLIKGRLSGAVLASLIDHAVERKRTETNLRLTIETLHILNRPYNLDKVVDELLRLIRRTLEFDAVGLRLKSGEDFPYYAQAGFSNEFVKEENFLCARGADAAIVRGEDGRPVLTCACGAVLSGRGDPGLPCFTENGSFWTNDSSVLFSLDLEEGPRARPRNGCIRSGYESVALIPLRSAGKIIGLLQLNDRRKDRFTLDMIRFYEGMGECLGIALKRRTAEEELRESADKFKSVFDNSVVGKSITRPDGEIQVNRSMAEMLGYTIEELNRMRWQDITHPDDVEASQSALEPLLSGAKDSVHFEKRYVHKDGSTVWAEVGTFLRRDDAGRPLYFITSINDITMRRKAEEALRENEERFRAVFEDGPVGMVMTSREFKFFRSNPAFCRMLGYSAEEMSVRTFLDVTHPDHRQADKESVEKMWRGEIPQYRTEKRYLTKTGEVRWGLLTASLIRNRSGRPVFSLAIIQDITPWKQAEERISAQLEELRRWHEATLGRENRVLDLKDEVNRLLREAGQPPRYGSVAAGLSEPPRAEIPPQAGNPAGGPSDPKKGMGR